MKFLFNPFERYSEKQLLFIGIISTTLGCFFAIFFNARFDGILDLHFVEKVKISEPIFDVFINTFCLSVLLFLTGKYCNKKTRFIDIITSILISKIPFYILVFQNINQFSFQIVDKISKSLLTKNHSIETITSTEMSFIIIGGILNLAFLAWSIILLFNGFKIASNAKNPKLILFFIGVILMSEIISKILISNFNKLW